jgi:hypothetical protein
VALFEIISFNYETTCGKTVVSFKRDFRLEPVYIGGLRSSGMLCGVGGKLVADVSGLSTDPFFRGRRTAWSLKKGPIYSLEKWETISHK